MTAGQEAAGLTASIVRSREMNAGVQLPFSFLFSPGLPPHPKNTATHT